MLKTYTALGRTFILDTEKQYLKPDNVSAMKMMKGNAMFYPINLDEFFCRLALLPEEHHNELYESLDLHIKECKSILGFINATEGEDYDTTLVVMDGPVESPSNKRTQELKDGLKNTISLFEQLRKTEN